jgi:predicted HicB family RNase H-like nuclease
MKQVNLRMPDDLHAQLVAVAAADQRSVNKEVLWLIERYVAACNAG